MSNNAPAPIQPVVSEVGLRITSGPHTGEERSLRGHETLVVGRAPDCQWQLHKDRHFSRYHFSIEANLSACILKDLDSSNGTIVRGSRVSDATLQHGDEIVCGDTRFAVTVRSDKSLVSQQTYSGCEGSQSTIELRLNHNPSFMDLACPEYDVQREIGRGGMGVVYYAVHKPSKREVALKLILPAQAVRQESIQLFFREASLLSRLRHARIVECLEIGVHEGCFYLAMEYVRTVDLRSILKTLEPAIQERVICGIICRVLEAIRYAHEQHVVHRDIKPANILVFRRERRLSAKLADFGLAKNYQHAGLSLISEESQMKGTLPFMPPEQIIDCRYAKPACDIYSVGASLYYLAAGCFAYDFDDRRNPIAQVLNSDPIPLQTRCPHVSAELAEIVSVAMARDPGKRFASAEEMRRALLPLTRPKR